MNKNSVALIIVFVFVLLLIVPAVLTTAPVSMYAAQQGNITGTFGINAPPTVNCQPNTDCSNAPDAVCRNRVSLRPGYDK